MGDRALIIFTDGKSYSPTVYLHWNGTEVPAWLEEHKQFMAARGGDVEYATARFIGLAHTKINGNLSLGVWNTDEKRGDAAVAVSTAEADSTEFKDASSVLAEHSHGDAGVVVVNVNSFTWKAFGGYLERHKQAA
jgi:hypothetical protein